MTNRDLRTTKSWAVHIDIGEHGGLTRATARLRTGDSTALVGTGSARCNPSDPDIPEIGDELAVSRALSHLAHVLLDAAADDISGVLREPVQLIR
jgi:hypothetical protein